MTEQITKNERPGSDEIDFWLWIIKNTRIILASKKIIALCTIIGLLIGIGMSFLLSKPIYKSQSQFILNIPEKINTSYGEFAFPSRRLEEYGDTINKDRAILLTLKDTEGKYTEAQLKKMINIQLDAATTILTISVENESPEEACRIATIHTKNYLAVIDYVLTQAAVKSFLDKQKKEVFLMGEKLITLQLELTSAKKELESTPMMVVIKSIQLDKNQAEQYYSNSADQGLDQFKDQVILSQIMNPSYEKLSILINQHEIDISSTENKINIAKKAIEELTAQKAELEKSGQGNIVTGSAYESFNLQESIMTTLEQPQVNNTSIGSSKLKIIGLSFFAGFVLGLCIVYIKAFSKRMKMISDI